jgi:hypothetical protein
MLEAEHFPGLFSDIVMPKYELLEIYRSKISLHSAKAGYRYPIIRLSHTFAKLAGLSTRIYQMVFGGSLAFLTVIASKENASERPKSSFFTRRRSPVRIRPGPLFFECFGNPKDPFKQSWL